MEYRILGPLEVVRDGAPVPIKGRHRPRLLAMLLLEPGRTVTLSRLVAALWDGEPPGTARRQAQNYMAALRRSLGPDAIASAGEGHRLVVEAATVDALRFEELVGQARARAHAGEHATAATRFDEALRLWRGPVLAGLPGREIEAAAERWQEKRLGAVEERAEVLSALGRHAEIVDELREVLREWPFRQRVAGQLMLALYRCGLRDEALAVYTELDARLRTELGIDPDRSVRELHGRMTRRDPTLVRADPESSAGPATAEIPVPAQLPADVNTFTGREAELAALDALLDDRAGLAVLSAVSGAGGVGKTALAVHWARRRRDRFPDGQLYINLRGFDHGEPVDPKDALSRFLRSLGVPGAQIPTGLEEASALYRAILSRRKVLAILDNAGTAEQVRPLLPGGKDTVAVVTSRNRLASLAVHDDAVLIGLDTLSPEESKRLISELVGTERANADPESLSRLVELCGRLPLALRIAAANLAGSPGMRIADLVDELDSAVRLELLTLDDDPLAGVAATFELSVDALDSRARTLLFRLGTIPGEDFPEGLAVAISDVPEAETRELLRRLHSAHLLEAHTAGRLRFHDLLKLYVNDRAAAVLPEPAREGMTDQIIDWYFRNRRELDPADIPNVVTACETFDDHPRLWRLAHILQLAMDRGVGRDAALAQCRVALRIAKEHGDDAGHARMLSALAVVHYMFGQTETAIEYSRKSVAVAKNIQDTDSYGAICNNHGLLLNWIGAFGEAEESLAEAVRATPSSSDGASAQIRMQNLGNTYRYLGRYADAATYLDRSAALLETIDNDLAVASNHIAKAMLSNDLGRHGEARDLADRALAAAHRCASPLSVVFATHQRAQAHWGAGDLDRARADFRESITHAVRVGLAVIEQRNYYCLSEIECDSGDRHRALEYLNAALSIDFPQPSRANVAELLRAESKLRVETRDFATAVELGQRALELFVAMPYPLFQARTLTVLAEAHRGLGHHSQAEGRLREALAVFTRLGVPEAERLKTSLDARPR